MACLEWAKVQVREFVEDRYPGFEAVFYSDLGDDDRARWDVPAGDAFFIRPEGRWPWIDDPAAEVVVGVLDVVGKESDIAALEIEGALRSTAEPFAQCYGGPGG